MTNIHDQQGEGLPRLVIEIPSVEHPSLLRALIDESDRRTVPIGRISQGSGLQLLSESEAREMVDLAVGRGMELYLFVSSRNSFESNVDKHGRDELVGELAFSDAVAELRRCDDLGVHGVLVADLGLLRVAGRMKAAGELSRLKIKTSVSIAPRNMAAAQLYEELGATSINVASAAPVDDIAAMRAGLSEAVGLDVYVESSDGLGSGLRYREAAQLVRRVAPVSLKIGLRQMPDLYPYGAHLEPMAERSIREKVRRAALLLDRLRSELGEQEVTDALAAPPLDVKTLPIDAPLSSPDLERSSTMDLASGRAKTHTKEL